MKKTWEVIIISEDRDDVDDEWNVEERVLFRTHKRIEADRFMYNHLYMETQLEPDDDGSHWLHIDTLQIRRIH